MSQTAHTYIYKNFIYIYIYIYNEKKYLKCFWKKLIYKKGSQNIIFKTILQYKQLLIDFWVIFVGFIKIMIAWILKSLKSFKPFFQNYFFI